jgi:hypothetical protein
MSTAECLLKSFAAFAAERGQTHVETQTAIDWAALGPSVAQRDARLRAVCRFVRHVRVEEVGRELPPANHLAPASGASKAPTGPGARGTWPSPHANEPSTFLSGIIACAALPAFWASVFTLREECHGSPNENSGRVKRWRVRPALERQHPSEPGHARGDVNGNVFGLNGRGARSDRQHAEPDHEPDPPKSRRPPQHSSLSLRAAGCRQRCRRPAERAAAPGAQALRPPVRPSPKLRPGGTRAVGLFFRRFLDVNPQLR